jgi:hypothetical protein
LTVSNFAKHPPQLIELISATKAGRMTGFLPAAHQSIQLMLSGERKSLMFHIQKIREKISMLKSIAVATLTAVLFTGCASVKMESKEASQKAKEFGQPSAGQSGLYIYRDSFVGKALKKDIWVDGKCVGESAPDVFFRTEVEGNQNHTVATESEFSPNTVSLFTEAGRNYFVRQYIKLGAFVGGADLEIIPEEQGKAAVAKLDMATPGTCSDAAAKK